LRRALSFFTLLSLAGYVWLFVSTHWVWVLMSAFLFLSWTSFSLPATFSLVGSSLAADRHAMGIGVQATLKRVPVILGPIAGGLLIDQFGIIRGMRFGVAAAIALACVTIAIQWQIQDKTVARSPVPALSFWQSVQCFNPSLRRLLLSDILVRFCERIPYAWVILYVMNNLGLTATQFGILTAIEMASAIACLIPVAYLSDQYGRQPFIMVTFILFTLFPVSLLFSHGFNSLCIAFTIRGLKEFGETARKSLIIELSPEPRRGQTIGTYYLIRDCLATAAAFLGAALWSISPKTNFSVAAATGAAGTLLYVWTTRRAPSDP
jgi:predicted MFS family arabinose efflux permease